MKTVVEEMQIELRLPELYPSQKEIAQSQARFKVLACG